VSDVQQMLAALPDRAPATPKQPRRVLVLGRAAGFVHSSIPLAARTIEALGMKTGAWTTVVTFNAADINPANLAQYDAIYLASTTGHFLDDANPNNDAAITGSNEARRKALMDFVRGGKGLAGVHAATDSYHGRGAPPAGAAPPAAGGRGGGPRMGTWQDFNHMIGGFFKFHWNYPTQIAVKVEEVNNPINAPFTTVNAQTGQRQARAFSIVDEVYTFEQNSWSRDRVRVLTSIDYTRMPQEVKEQEPANGRRTDGDYGLSYIRREGNGRVFVNVLGHHESIYKDRAMLEHTLAGMQYVLGDLQGVDDSPSGPRKP
jgi:type 1 glutamine amidotransferase